VTLENALSLMQAAALIGGAGVAVWKIAATTGDLGREIKHLGSTISDLKVVVQQMSHEMGTLQTRVAVIEEQHRNGMC